MKKIMKIYVDMDGVLADFFGEWVKLSDNPVAHWKDMTRDMLTKTLGDMIGTDFFFRLGKFPTADTLTQYITDMFGEYRILSAPLRKDIDNSVKWKRKWVKRNLKIQPVEVIINHAKFKWAVNEDGSPNVLIDDRTQNLEAWEKAGGIGIRYQANEDNVSDVVVALEKYI